MTVLVVGAAGDLGGRVVHALTQDDVAVRALVRRPEAMESVAVSDVVLGDLGDPASLTSAMAGVRALFLVSSPTRDQVQLETNAVEAAEAAGVARIVKVSNIPIPGVDGGLHGNHRAIERRLAESSVASTVLEPSFFTTVLDRQRALIAPRPHRAALRCRSRRLGRSAGHRGGCRGGADTRHRRSAPRHRTGGTRR